MEKKNEFKQLLMELLYVKMQPRSIEVGCDISARALV